MNTTNSQTSNPIVEQVTNNTTSWVGHNKNQNKEISRGQTFVASSEADVNAIECIQILLHNQAML